MFSRSRERDARRAADALYRLAVRQARHEAFYRDAGVSDTVDGRFDMIALHAFLLLRGLKGAAPEDAATGRALLETMVDDLDRSLREMGAGDLGVGRRVKAMASALYGRIAAYEAALDDPDALAGALRRNLYRGGVAPADAPAAMADYVRREAKAIAALPRAELRAGRVRFGAPPGAAPGASPGASPGTAPGAAGVAT